MNLFQITSFNNRSALRTEETNRHDASQLRTSSVELDVEAMPLVTFDGRSEKMGDDLLTYGEAMNHVEKTN